MPHLPVVATRCDVEALTLLFKAFREDALGYTATTERADRRTKDNHATNAGR